MCDECSERSDCTLLEIEASPRWNTQFSYGMVVVICKEYGLIPGVDVTVSDVDA